MKYEYKYLDFFTEAEEESVLVKIKEDVLAMLGFNWTIVFTIKFGTHTTIYFKRQVKTEDNTNTQ